MKNSKKSIMIIAIIILIALIGYVVYGVYQKATYKPQNPVVTMEVKDFGTMKIELYPDIAPNTVRNFIALANNGFYNGLTFHRIIADFMIQGGDKEGTGKGSPTLENIYNLDEVLNDKKLFEDILSKYYDNKYTKDDKTITSYKEAKELLKKENDGKSTYENKSIFEDFLKQDYSIKGEFYANGYRDNNLRHDVGIISMARSDYSQMGMSEEGYNSAGSQFFIVTKASTNLNRQYAAFGKVTEGLDVLDKIKAVEVKSANEGEEGGESSSSSEVSTPVNPPVIEKVTVDTFGVDYKKPEILKPFDYSKWLKDTYGLDANALD